MTTLAFRDKTNGIVRFYVSIPFFSFTERVGLNKKPIKQTKQKMRNQNENQKSMILSVRQLKMTYTSSISRSSSS
jgi:hypothetical protein